MTDLTERLRMWPAADGKDGLAAHFVEGLMGEAAAELDRLQEVLGRVRFASRLENWPTEQFSESEHRGVRAVIGCLCGILGPEQKTTRTEDDHV